MGKTAPAVKPVTKSATKHASKPVNKPAAKSTQKSAIAKPTDKKTAKVNIKGDLDALFKTKSKAIKKVKKEEPKNKTAPKKLADAADEKSKPIRYTEDGLRIYTEEELKIGQGGDTADCPFDCNCCF